MKKTLAVILAFIMIAGCMSSLAFAEETPTVFVTIANKGAFATAQIEVAVTDIDGDDKLTVNDALYAAHEASYSGGASSGYGYYTHKDYGLSLGKLWGDTSGNFGYYINDKSCWGLADEVKDGDYVSAFVYSDGKYYSDKYSFFTVRNISVKANSDIELTLCCAGYDANWNPVTLPVANAEITVDGKATGVKTDANGKATIQLSSSGEYLISAVSDSETLVPPVCVAQVSGGLFASIISAVISLINTVISLFLSLVK
ncbi:MAG: hypothetical protein IJO36_04105 [Clostridia bacterium]|nr:hypothetical protein [Clostridia bacterium]